MSDDLRRCPRCRDRDMPTGNVVCWGCRQELTADGDGDWYAAYQREQAEHSKRQDLVASADQLQTDTAYALLIIQLSALGQQPLLRAQLDKEQRVTLRYLCEDLARQLKEEAGE